MSDCYYIGLCKWYSDLTLNAKIIILILQYVLSVLKFTYPTLFQG